MTAKHSASRFGFETASTDATEAICRRIAAQDSRVRYDRAPRNVGLVPNHRRVLAMATGEYFMFAPHDDWFAPDYVERVVRRFVVDRRAGERFAQWAARADEESLR